MSEWELDRTRFFFTERMWSTVPRSIRRSFTVVPGPGGATEDGAVPCLFAYASELLEEGRRPASLPRMPDTRYAIVLDEVPVPELLRIPTVLGLHKPDRRAHFTEDVGVVRRAAISLLRDHPIEGILDAWFFEGTLTILLADLGKRRYDPARIPSLAGMGPEKLAGFEIDEDGSFLHWPERDVHLGVSQILQTVDPRYLAQLEIERNALDYTPWALEAWRREEGIRQVDVEGLSARQVRRIEQGISRLTAEAARTFARAFGLPTRTFLDELAKRTRETRESVEREAEREERASPEVAVLDPAA